jgi:catechol 2,3-dioxygenase-like lactoylglutathione lyase family enzyme
MMIKQCLIGFQHIGIPTNDIKATIDFYKALGFEIVKEEYLEKENCRVCFLKMDTLMLETYENKNPAFKAGSIDHIALDVSDIDVVYNFAKAKGFTILGGEITKLPFWSKGIKCFNIEGPNREKIEFCQIL